MNGLVNISHTEAGDHLFWALCSLAAKQGPSYPPSLHVTARDSRKKVLRGAFTSRQKRNEHRVSSCDLRKVYLQEALGGLRTHAIRAATYSARDLSDSGVVVLLLARQRRLGAVGCLPYAML
jgi:hypothetical protein